MSSWRRKKFILPEVDTLLWFIPPVRFIMTIKSTSWELHQVRRTFLGSLEPVHVTRWNVRQPQYPARQQLMTQWRVSKSRRIGSLLPFRDYPVRFSLATSRNIWEIRPKLITHGQMYSNNTVRLTPAVMANRHTQLRGRRRPNCRARNSHKPGQSTKYKH